MYSNAIRNISTGNIPTGAVTKRLVDIPGIQFRLINT